MAHFFQAALGREAERERAEAAYLDAGHPHHLTTTTSDPDEGFIYLYIYTHTHRSSCLSQPPLDPSSHAGLYRFMVAGKMCPAVE